MCSSNFVIELHFHYFIVFNQNDILQAKFLPEYMRARRYEITLAFGVLANCHFSGIFDEVNSILLCQVQDSKVVRADQLATGRLDCLCQGQLLIQIRTDYLGHDLGISVTLGGASRRCVQYFFQ